jgi:hypothetical protein
MAQNIETEQVRADELRADDKVLASNGKFRQVRVAVPTQDTGLIVVAYISGGQDRWPTDELVTIRKRERPRRGGPLPVDDPTPCSDPDCAHCNPLDDF